MRRVAWSALAILLGCLAGSAGAERPRSWDSALIPLGGRPVLARIIAPSGPPPVDLTTGLGGYWRLDDGSGSSAADSSGLGRTATMAGSYTWGDGYVAVSPSASGYVQPPAAATVAGANRATICLWIWPQTWAGTAGRGVYREETSTAGYLRLGATITSGAVLRVQVRDASADPSGTAVTLFDSPANPVSTQAWHHLCIVIDSVSDAHWLYADGVQIASSSAAIGAFGSSASGARFVGAGTTADVNTFDGRIAGVRLWVGRALTAAEIRALYARGRP